MAVLCLVTSLSGTALAEAVKGTSSPKSATTTSKAKSATSAGSSKAGTTKAKTKAKSSAGSASTTTTPRQNTSLSSPKGEDNPNPAQTGPRPAAVTSINVDELAGFDAYPKKVRSLVSSAVALTHLGLTYTFGSSEPSKGGMDCSGTMYHVLRFQGLKDVPRQSDEMCAWVRDQSRLRLTPTAQQFSHPEFDALRPGDLLFWTGTMETKRKLPVTHVMLYLGKLKSTGKRVVFGSSDGRSYEGQRRCGVSVFDFDLPRPGGKAAFYGYGPAPGLAAAEYLEEIRRAELPVIAAAEPAPAPAAVPDPVPAMPAAPKKTEPMKEPDVAALAKVTPAVQSPAIPVKDEPPTPADTPAAKVPQASVSTGKTIPSITSTRTKPKATKAPSSMGTTAKATPASPQSPSSSKGTAAKSSTAPVKKVATKPVTARPKPAPAKPEGTPEKVEKAMRRVVNSIRGAFQ